MSPQHDWLQHFGPDSEPSRAGDGAGQADAASDGEPAEAGQQAGTAPVEAGRSGWSGRAVGPLSGLLPGAVELNADELPVEPAASQVVIEANLPEDDAPAGDEAPPGDEVQPAAQVDEEVEDTERPEPGLSATDDRWHAALVGFVDDPRGSVEAARALIDEDIAAHIALLARRKEAMHAAWQASEDADTEALRVSLVHYRDLRKRLVDVSNALPA